MVERTAQTLPFAWYSDPEQLRREQDRIFRGAWHYAGHAGELSRPGDFAARMAGHLPVVVVHGEDGILRAFLNVCRHRGSVVVEGTGNRRTLQCRYHAWTYGLDGSLRAAPRADREEWFDPSELGLVPAQVANLGPLMFVNADANAPPLAALLGDLPDRLASGGVDLDALEFSRRVDYEVDANWKIVIENYLECYHCPVAHPRFSRVVDVDPDAYTLEASEWYSSQVGPAREPNGEIGAGRFFFLWPTTRINVFPGRPNLSVGTTLPAGPERTSGFLDYFFAPDVPEEWAVELIAFDDQVGREDRELVESVQRGAGSGAVDHGRLLLSSEHLVAHFHDLVRRALV